MSEYSNYIDARDAVVGALNGTEKMAGSKNGSAMGWTTQQIANLAATVAATAFVDGETPSGTIDGVNAAFTLANTPVTGSVHLYLPFRLKLGVDYTISGANITMIAIPQIGDTFLADYRK